jgi:mercuric ion transport protein
MSTCFDTTDKTKPIAPRSTETVREVLASALTALGWRERHKLGVQEDAVHRYILAQHPVLGRAPTHQEIVDALKLDSPHDAQQILSRLHELDLVYLDPASRAVHVAYPFSTVPTNHVVRFPSWAEAKLVYAACAIDALGMSFMLHRDLSIVSSCAHCEAPIGIEVRDSMIVARYPETTVVWVGMTRSPHAAASVCPLLNFFCSPAHVAAWWHTRPAALGHVLSLGEALYLGKRIFEDLLDGKPGKMTFTTTLELAPGPRNVGTTATSAGGLVAAFLASICCIGPLVVAALGVGVGATGFLASTASVLKALLPYRPLFIGLTAVLLGIGFYQVYRKLGPACSPKASCRTNGSVRKKQVLLWIATVVATALVLAPYWLSR